MEKSESIFSRDKFNSVWQRVRPEPPALPGAGETTEAAGRTAQVALPGAGETTEAAGRTAQVALPGAGAVEAKATVLEETVAPLPTVVSEVVSGAETVVPSAPTLPTQRTLVAERVAGAAAPTKKTAANAVDSAVLDELERLRDFMDREAEAARYYCQLAARCGGRVRQVCEGLAADCRRSIRRLNTRYFILTGEVYEPSSSVAPVTSVQETLRRACADEIALANDYLDAAETTTVPGLAEIYGECACAAQRRAACVTRLLERMM